MSLESSFRPAARISSIGVSEILKIVGRAAQRKREGHDVITLAAGEPDFDTPDHIKDAAARAMREGATKYTALDGSDALKSAIRDKFRRQNGLDYSLAEITAAAGAKQIIYNAMMASLDEGDEVILPNPYWVSYADIVRICGGRPVFVPCTQQNGFRLTPEDLERAITPRSRWLILNSPSNPSGAAYSREQYLPVLEVLDRHPDVWLLADDIYEHIVYDQFRFVSPAAIHPPIRNRTLTLNGISKGYAMTGWRLGYAGGPASLIKAMGVIQSQSTSCPSSISQAATVAALNGPQEFMADRTRSFQERRDLVVAALNRIKGISCPTPEGAFYTFASCAGMLGKTTPKGKTIESDVDFADYLLDEANVALVPGSAFGLAPFFRISYASGKAELEEACRRIAHASAALR